MSYKKQQICFQVPGTSNAPALPRTTNTTGTAFQDSLKTLSNRSNQSIVDEARKHAELNPPLSNRSNQSVVDGARANDEAGALKAAMLKRAQTEWMKEHPLQPLPPQLRQ